MTYAMPIDGSTGPTGGAGTTALPDAEPDAKSAGTGLIEGREVQLVGRPVGMPKESDFRVVESKPRELGDDELLVRNTWLSVDPYMRLRMNGAKSYLRPFELGEALEGESVGEVIESTSNLFDRGDHVLHGLGWREQAVVPASSAQRIDPELAPASAYLGVLGWPGFTAYVGLLDIAELREGDVVFVSAAAGAVGSLAGQIARVKGHRVIGSAGSAEKVAYLIDDLGFDAAFNYRSGPVVDLLREAVPDGIDVYFDNVGGEHLEAALECMSDHGRIAMCGAISAYNATEPPTAPRNLFKAVSKQLRLQGFLIGEDPERWQQFTDDVAGWLREGQISYRETVYDGIENAVRAFISMLSGANIGKMLVRL